MGNTDSLLKRQLIFLNFKAQIHPSWLLLVDATDYHKLKTIWAIAAALSGPPALVSKILLLNMKRVFVT